MSNLLPPNATAQEVALAGTTDRIDAIPVKTRQMWNPQTCPAELLPWLAWALSVDEWNTEWSEQQKRNTIAASFRVHSTKGTLAAVKTSLMALGYDSTVIEWFQQPGELEPYTFTVDIDAALTPITGDIFNEATRLIEQTKNTRSHLARLRVATSAPVNFFAAAAQLYGVYCATGGALSVVGGRPKLLKANALALATAAANLTNLISRYFALGTATGFIGIYKVEGQTFTRLADPDVVPTNGSSSWPIYGFAFSPNADYMVIGSNSAPRLMFYKRTGDTFTKLADPATLPTNGNPKPAFSPDGVYLATNVTFQKGVIIYKRTGDTFTKLADPADAPEYTTTCAAWNMDGTIVAFGRGASVLQPYLYSRSGDTFTKIPFPTTALPQITTNDLAFSPVSNLLIVCSNATPFITVSSVTAGVHTRHADPAVQPASQANSCAFNGDGSLLFVGTQSHGLIIYSVSGTTLTKLADVAGSPNQISCVRFNHDFSILTVTANAVQNYAVSGSTLTPMAAVPSLPAGTVETVAHSR